MALTGAGLNSMRSIPTFGTIGAIAEIVDNSIQWKTDNESCFKTRISHCDR